MRVLAVDAGLVVTGVIMGRIFISYRRDDNLDFVEHVADRLKDRFGKSFIFQDVVSMPPGANFREHVRDAIAHSDIEIVVIGQRWLAVTNDGAMRKLDRDDDPVRIEVEAALANRVPIIPVLIDDASMPGKADLPHTIAKLADIHASRVRRNPDFDADIQKLMRAIRGKRLTTARRSQRNVHRYIADHSTRIKRLAMVAVPAILIVVLLVCAIGYGILPGNPTSTVPPGPSTVSPSAHIVIAWGSRYPGYLAVTLTGFSPGSYNLICNYLRAKSESPRLTQFTVAVVADPETFDNGKTCDSGQVSDVLWVSYGIHESQTIPAGYVYKSATATPIATSPAVTPTPGVAETAGGIAHTWTNYATAGGAQGPSIFPYQAIQVSCKIIGFQVFDGNTWWYRIAQSPWNNVYYASADSFYNNGQASGSLMGTPLVDVNVPNC